MFFAVCVWISFLKSKNLTLKQNVRGHGHNCQLLCLGCSRALSWERNITCPQFGRQTYDWIIMWVWRTGCFSASSGLSGLDESSVFWCWCRASCCASWTSRHHLKWSRWTPPAWSLLSPAIWTVTPLFCLRTVDKHFLCRICIHCFRKLIFLLTNNRILAN